jgi:hypothetical protein
MDKGTHSADWRKSSYSNGAGECVEVATWRTSTYSNGSGNCVEVGSSGGVRVRDTKDHDGTVLHVSTEAWECFTASLQ